MVNQPCERIGRDEVEEMYRYVGKLMKQHPYLSTYILTSNKEFEYLVDRKATKRRKLFNGYIECTYYQYWGKSLILINKFDLKIYLKIINFVNFS